MTDIFEGSVIRLARRLDEFLNQVLFKSSLPRYSLKAVYLGIFYVVYALLSSVILLSKLVHPDALLEIR